MSTPQQRLPNHEKYLVLFASGAEKLAGNLRSFQGTEYSHNGGNATLIRYYQEYRSVCLTHGLTCEYNIIHWGAVTQVYDFGEGEDNMHDLEHKALVIGPLTEDDRETRLLGTVATNLGIGESQMMHIVKN